MLIDSGVVTSSLSVSGSYNQTGNAVITGSLTVTGGITGSITSASYAFNADLLDDLDSTAFLYTSSFNTFSSSYSNRISGSEVTASVLTAASSSLSVRVTNTEATASSLVNASGSFSTRVSNTEATASFLTTASGSFSTRVTGLETASGSFSTRTTNLETTSSNLVNASGSFSTRVTNTEATASSLSLASGSFSTRVTNTEATASNLVPRVINLEATASNLTSASGSFSTRVTGLEAASGSFSTRVTNTETSVTTLTNASASFAVVSGSYSPMSGSTSTRLTSLESASGSFSTRVTNTEATASNLVPRVALLETTASNFVLTSGSVSSRVTNLEVTASSLTTRTTNLETASGSFSTRVTSAESSITSLTNASGSFSTRVTNEEATGSRLVTASGSFSTRVTTNETNISSLQTASGSTSTRLTNLESASGSFSTRVTTLESASGSTSTRLTSLETASGSFSTRVTNTEATASNLVPRVTLLETTASNFVLTSGSVSSRVTNLEATASSLTSITNNLTAASGSFSTRTTNLESTSSVLTNASASFVNMSSSLSIRVTNAEASVTSLNAKTGSYATTGSNTFTGTQTVQGTIIAQTLNVQQVTSSIVYSSGSNIFGKLTTDVQQFTGSLRVSGSGEHWIMGGSVGIGTTAPTHKLNTVISYAGGNFLGDANVYALALKNNDTTAGNAVALTFGQGGYTYTNFIASVRTGTGGDPKGDLVFGGRPSDGATFTEWMRLQAGGNVGIGTTNPNGKLQVIAANTYSRFWSNSSTAYTFISIGRTSSDLELGVAGNTDEFFTGAVSGDGAIKFSGKLLIGNSGITSPAMTVSASGNVGIGTTSPSQKLEVSGSGRFSTGQPDVQLNITDASQYARLYFFESNVGLSGVQQIGSTFSTTARRNRLEIFGSALSFINGNFNSPAMTVTGSNVGIGTTSPTAKLEVVYSGGYNDGIKVRSTSGFAVLTMEASADSYPILEFKEAGVQKWQIYNAPGDDSLNIYALDASTGNKVTILNGGNVGIGTSSPEAKLEVYGSEIRIDSTGTKQVYLRNVGSGNTGSFVADGYTRVGSNNSSVLGLMTNNVDRITILSGGNVGIGTSPTQATLHVNGNVYATSYTGSFSGTFASPGSNTQMIYNNAGSLGAASNVYYYDAKIGINTSSPRYPLEVTGSGTGYNERTIAIGNTAVNGTFMYLGTSKGSGGYSIIQSITTEGANYGDLVLNPNGGNVGINNPSPQAYFDVKSTVSSKNIYRATDSSDQYRWRVDQFFEMILTNTSGTDVIKLGQSGSYLNSGNVGIGTTSANEKLVVRQTTNNYSSVGLYTSASSGQSYGPLIQAGTTSADATLRVYDQTGGLPYLYISGNGNIGINTSSPSAKLNIRTDLSPYTSQSLFELSSEAAWKLRFESYHNGGGYDYRVIQNDNGPDINMLTFKSGNIGIGTTNPVTKLDVNGEVKASNYYATGVTGFWSDSYGVRRNGFVADGTNLVFRAGTSGTGEQTRMVISQADGNVGINTTSPGARLDITVAGGALSNNALATRAGNASSTSGSNQIILSYDGTLNYGHAIKTRHQSGAASGNNIDFYTWNYGTDTLSTIGTKFVMTIEGSGNVGIGSKIPSQTLDVTGTGRFLSLIVDGASNSNNATISLTRTDSSWGIFNETDLRFYQTGSNNRYPGSVRMVLSSGGNLGLNTNLSGINTAGLLTIKGANSNGNQIYIVQENDDRGWRFRAKNDGHFYLQSSYVGADTDRLKINYDDGNVGIGTTSPSQLVEAYKSSNGDVVYQITNPNSGTAATAQFFASNGTTRTQFFHTGTSYNAGGSGILTNAPNLGGIYNNQRGVALLAANAAGSIMFGIGSSNTEIMRITGSYVGIGTTSPVTKLQVNAGAVITGATSGIDGIRIVGDADKGIEWFLGHANGYNGWVANAKVNNVGSAWADGYLEFCTSTTSGASLSTMTLKNGNVGIGTTSPAYRLTVNNDIGFTTGASLKWGANTYIYGNNNAQIEAVVNGNYGIFINSNGNVGVGTSSPAYKLDVRSGAVYVAGGGFSGPESETGYRVKMYDNGGVHNDPGIGLDGAGGAGEIMWFNAYNGFYFNLGTQGVKVKIDSSGNVGIGTTSPANKLQIGSVGTTGFGANDIAIGNGTQVMTFYQSSTISNWYTNTSFALLPAGAGAVGNVGIGSSSPAYRLDVSGQGRFSGVLTADSDILTRTKLQISNGRLFEIIGSSTSLNIYDGSAGSSRMLIDSNGNVGIGTTTVPSKLTIAPAALTTVSTIEFTNTDNAVISSHFSQTFAIDNTNAVGGRSFVFAKGAKGYGNQPSTLMQILGDTGATMARSVNLSGAKVGQDEEIGSLAGLVGWYTGDSYNATDKVWYDISGNANHTNGSQGSPTKVTFSGGVQNAYKSFSVVSGSTSDALVWPTAILPTTYTLFHVARYAGGTEARIFSGYTTNWLSGFWSGNSGVAFHQGWITDQTDHFTTNWVLSTDQNSYYKGQSNASVYSATGGGGTSDRLSINAGNNGEPSNWMVAEVIVFNRSLTTEEILYVETYLARKYGLPNNNNYFQGNINATGDIIAYFSSDAKLKDNISAIESPLEKISKINGVSFNWNDKQSVYETGKKDYGVIAQEVEEVLPELVTTRDSGYKAVRYEKIVPLLIEAIKEQQHQIDELKYLLQNK